MYNDTLQGKARYMGIIMVEPRSALRIGEGPIQL